MKGFLNGLRFAIKYGAYVTVIFEIIGYAIEKFEAIEVKQASKD